MTRYGHIDSFTRGLLVLIFLTIVLSVDPLTADESPAGWQPDPPMPDEFDWIQLTSDEWLKGEFIAMYDENLEFDSDELEMLSLDWEDIKQVRSAQVMQVLFVGKISATGKLFIEGENVRIIGKEDQQFNRSQIVSITAGEPREINYWSAKVSIGANFRSGNTEQIENNFKAKIQRRTPENRLIFDYLGNYNKTEEIETTNNHRINGVWNRFITDRFFLTPAFGEYYRDPFQNIAHRSTIGAGVGYQIIDTALTEWQFSGGPAYQNTRFQEVEAGEDKSQSTPAVVLSTLLEREITSDIDFDFEYHIQITNEATGTFNHHLLAGFETELTSILDFDISVVWDRIQDPQAGEYGTVPEKDDYRLILALGLDI